MMSRPLIAAIPGAMLSAALGAVAKKTTDTLMINRVAPGRAVTGSLII